MKKLVRYQGGGPVEVTHYIRDAFEHHRWTGAATGENNQIHVMDDQQRIALVRTGPAHPRDRGPATAYQLTDHLGSSTATLDDTGTLTNREEYTPYGETSFGSYTLKRYRFTGQERDEESGLAKHQRRYLAPWIGRWTGPDPGGPVDGCNAFTYVKNNPLSFIDPTGTQGEEANSTPAPSGPEDYTNLTCGDDRPAGYYVVQGAFRDESDRISAGTAVYGERLEDPEKTCPLTPADVNGSPATHPAPNEQTEEEPKWYEFSLSEARFSVDGEGKVGAKNRDLSSWSEYGIHAKLSIQPTLKLKPTEWSAFTVKGPGAWIEGRAGYEREEGIGLSATAGVSWGSVGVELSDCWGWICLGGEVEVGPKLEIGTSFGVDKHGRMLGRAKLPLVSAGAGIWLSEEGMKDLSDMKEPADKVMEHVYHSIAPELNQKYPAGVVVPF